MPSSATASAVGRDRDGEDGYPRACRRRGACARTCSSAPTARTASSPGRPGSVPRSFAASRSRATCPSTALDRDLERTAVIELATRSRRLRLGLPEGRPREPRRRRVGQRGAAAARAPRAPRARARARARRPHRRPRAPPADAAGSARRRARGACCSSATPRGSSTRFRATGCTRRSSRPGSRPTRSSQGDLAGYTGALAATLDRHAAASWAAKRAFDRYPRIVFAAARAPGVFTVVAGLLCGDVAHPADARGVARGPLKLIARLAG